jgi:hypothetical protein
MVLFAWMMDGMGESRGSSERLVGVPERPRVYVLNNVTHLANTTASRIHTLKRSKCQLCVLTRALMRRQKDIRHLLILRNH